jgi:hypothetical protein
MIFFLCGGMLIAQTKTPITKKSGGDKHAENVLKANPDAKVSERKPASVKGMDTKDPVKPAQKSAPVVTESKSIKTSAKETPAVQTKAATTSPVSKSKVSLYEMEGVEPGAVKKSTAVKKTPPTPKSAAAPKSNATLKTREEVQSKQQAAPANGPVRKTKADVKGATSNEAVQSTGKASAPKKELPKKQ